MNDPHTAPEQEVYGADIQRLPARELVKKIGPGLISTGIVIGPGAITTAAMIGGNYGYQLIWLLIPIIFMGITFMMTTNRLAILTGMPIIHAIRKYYGPVASSVVGIATFLACLFFTMGNISGTGAGMNLIFGLDWKIGALVMIAALIVCYFTKGVYSKIEKLITICILGMIISFYATLVGVGGPDWGALGSGLVGFAVPAGSLVTALGFISTNASVTTGVYNTYLGVEKKWKKEDLFNGVMLTDAIVHVLSVVLISGAIILVGAIVLFPTGQSISAPAQLADMLAPVMGNAARYIMGVALLGAGFSSLLGNTQRGVVLLNAGFDKPTSLEDKSIRIGSLLVIAVTAVICFNFGGSPVQLIYIANVATSVATPVAGLFIVLMLWRSDINQGYKKPTVLRICMTISYLFVLVMTASSLITTVPQMIRSLLG